MRRTLPQRGWRSEGVRDEGGMGDKQTGTDRCTLSEPKKRDRPCKSKDETSDDLSQNWRRIHRVEGEDGLASRKRKACFREKGVMGVAAALVGIGSGLHGFQIRNVGGRKGMLAGSCQNQGAVPVIRAQGVVHVPRLGDVGEGVQA